MVKRLLILGVPCAVLALAATALGLLTLAGAAAAAPGQRYSTHNLVSDQAGKADHVDPSLVNAWGLASRVDSPWWVADNGTSRATVYTADGSAFAPVGAPLVTVQPRTRSTRGWRAAATACSRPTSATAAWTCSTAAPGCSADLVPSSTASSRAGSPRSGSRQSAAASSSPTTSRTPTVRTTSTVKASVSSTR